MSATAPLRPLTVEEHRAELRHALAWSLARIEDGGGVTSCTGLDSGDTEAALFAYLHHRTPAALAAVHVAAARQLAGWLPTA